MDPARPKVSVVMAVHNRADLVAQALASVRWQTLTDWECLCVDDGSTDATPEVLARFAAADPRFRVLRQAKAGVAAALNLGDHAARADYIARMDSDDVMVPTRLELQHAHLESHPECIAVGGQMMHMDPTGAFLGRTNYPLEHEEIDRRMLSRKGGTIPHPTLVYRREALARVGDHRPKYDAAHDADFLIRLAGAGRIANLPELVMLYRLHTGSYSSVRYAEIRRQLIDIGREAHAARGIPFAEPSADELRFDRPRTPAVGKWARRAAEHGYFATAFRLAAQQFAEKPMSVYAMRVFAEVALRSAKAALRGTRGERVELPDWADWDCPPADAPERLAA